MTKGYNFIVNFIAIFIIAGLTFGAFSIYQQLSSQNTEVLDHLDLNIIVLSISILLGALAVRSGVIKSSKYSKASLPEKTSTYKRFIDYFYSGLPLDDGWHELTTAMTLWASDSVLRQYLQLIKMLEEKEELNSIQQKAEKVILEIRKDQGNTNLGILAGDIIKTEKRFERYESKKKTQATANI